MTMMYVRANRDIQHERQVPAQSSKLDAGEHDVARAPPGSHPCRHLATAPSHQTQSRAATKASIASERVSDTAAPAAAAAARTDHRLRAGLPLRTVASTRDGRSADDLTTPTAAPLSTLRAVPTPTCTSRRAAPQGTALSEPPDPSQYQRRDHPAPGPPHLPGAPGSTSSPNRSRPRPLPGWPPNSSARLVWHPQ